MDTTSTFPNPGQYEVENFFRKFQDLRSAGWDTEFYLGVRDGKQWVSLHVRVGDQQFPVPSFKPDNASPKSQAVFRHRRRNGGRLCRERRRARRVIATLELLPFHLDSEESTTDSHHSYFQSSVEMVDPSSPSAEMVDPPPSPAEMVDPSPPSAEMVDSSLPSAETVEPSPAPTPSQIPFPSSAAVVEPAVVPSFPLSAAVVDIESDEEVESPTISAEEKEVNLEPEQMDAGERRHISRCGDAAASFNFESWAEEVESTAVLAGMKGDTSENGQMDASERRHISRYRDAVESLNPELEMPEYDENSEARIFSNKVQIKLGAYELPIPAEVSVVIKEVIIMNKLSCIPLVRLTFLWEDFAWAWAYGSSRSERFPWLQTGRDWLFGCYSEGRKFKNKLARDFLLSNHSVDTEWSLECRPGKDEWMICMLLKLVPHRSAPVGLIFPDEKVYKNFCAAADRAMALQRGTYCGKDVVLNRSGSWSTCQEFSEKFPVTKIRIPDFYMHNV